MSEKQISEARPGDPVRYVGPETPHCVARRGERLYVADPPRNKMGRLVVLSRTGMAYCVSRGDLVEACG